MTSDRATVVRVAGLCKTFVSGAGEPVLALREATFDLRAGEVTLITGASGSGKTTLLSIIGGLMPATSGVVEIGGVTLSSLSQAHLTRLRLRSIGFVFQGFRLIDALTVLENVELVLNLAGTWRPASRAIARQLIDRLDLTTRADFFPGRLSAGEKQRVALARALANHPQLILADEPTGNLDSHAGHRVIELLRAASREDGHTVLIVSHDLRIRQHVDHAFDMEDGRLTAVEPAMTQAASFGWCRYFLYQAT